MKQNRNAKNTIVIIFLLLSPFIAFADTKYLNEKCEEGNGKACMDLSSYYRSGSRYHDIKKNDIKAKHYYEKYYQLANSKLNSIEELIKQCNYGLSDVCRYIAYCYRDGKRVMKNKDKEIEYYKKACKLGDLYICEKIPVSNNMSEYFSSAVMLTDSKRKYSMLKKACDGGYAKSCNYLFQKYKSNGKEREASKYFQKTKILMENDCNQNDAESCQWMWNYYIYIKKRDEGKIYFNKAKELYKKECDSSGSSCLAYQLLLKDGY